MQVIRNGTGQRRRSINMTRRRALADGDQYTPIRLTLTAQWKLNEASGNAIDSKGGYTLTQTGTVGTTTGKLSGCRTASGTSYLSRVAEAALQPLGVDFSYSIWFWVATSGGNRQIFSLRNAGSADGNLHHILRTEVNALVFYSGDGVGGLDTSTITINVGMGAWHHLACSFKNSTKELRYSFDGGAVVSDTLTAAPTTSPATPTIALMGDTLELMESGGRIDEVDYAVGSLWPDSYFTLLWNGGSGVEL